MSLSFLFFLFVSLLVSFLVVGVPYVSKSTSVGSRTQASSSTPSFRRPEIVIDNANQDLVFTSSDGDSNEPSQTDSDCGGEDNILKIELSVANRDNCIYQGLRDGRCGTNFDVQATKKDDGTATGLLKKEVWERNGQIALVEVDITCMEYVVRNNDDSNVSVYVGGYIANHPDPSFIGSFVFTSMSGGTMDGSTPTLWPADNCEEAMDEFLGNERGGLAQLKAATTTKGIPHQLLKDGNLKVDLC